MSALLPYPGFSWSFTQHAVGLAPDTLYKLLECSAQFEGSTSGYGKKITELMIAANILTVNEREGIPDAWRDYQQILAELGLIYSTRICPALTITEVGHLFLAGEIGFSELMSMQAFRYQYPNGQKSVIQSRLRTILSESNVLIPESLIELQSSRNILLKPAILILRVLIGLLKFEGVPALTINECQAFLINYKRNEDWGNALNDVVKFRGNPFDLRNINRHARRNVQDWFKFLSKTDYFSNDNPNALILSDYALSNIKLMEDICEEEEALDNFWIPIDYDNASKLSWFKFYGSYTSSAEILSKENLDEKYILDNYVAGTSDELDSTMEKGVLLKPLDLEYLSRKTSVKIPVDFEVLVNNVLSGIQKRHSKTLLHDALVRDIAEKCLKQGAIVESDPDSIDLLATWPSGESAIFEMKTVSKKSLKSRLRMAIGQVEEYVYRHSKLSNGVAEKIIVINTKLDKNSWQKDFLNNHLNIGLICKTPFDYSAFAPKNSQTGKFWDS